MTDTKEYFIDTNIIVYAFEKGVSGKKEIAKQIIDECFDGKTLLSVSNQILAEFFFISTEKLKLNSEEARKVIESIIERETIIKIRYDEKTIVSAIHIQKENKIPFWDALIAATMLENNIHSIYTENTKDFSIAGITAINPFTVRKQKKRHEPARN